MNKCNKCDALFETPATETIMHYEVDTRREELIPVCPECGSDEFEEVTICKGCDMNYIKSSEGYCQHCYNDVSLWVAQLGSQKRLSFMETVDLIESYLARF